MVLLASAPGAVVTQGFGPSVIRVEPTMWTTNKARYAAWSPYAGATEYEDFHPGIDRADDEGSPVLAMEAGTVVFSGWRDSISGHQVEVEIRPGTRFSGNHYSSRLVTVGQKVSKGQPVARMGSTGASTGPHVHEGVSIVADDGHGIRRTFQYDPRLFLQGGEMAGSALIEPLVQLCRVEAGSVIWYAGQGFDDQEDIFAYARRAAGDGARRAGIFRHGRRIGSLRYRFTFIRWRETVTQGTVAIVTGFRQRLAIRKQDMYFV